MSDWKSMKPTSTSTRNLKATYADILRKTISKVNPYCVLAFTGIHRVKKKGSHKKTLPYLKGTACCKMTGCSQYVFSMAEEPTG